MCNFFPSPSAILCRKSMDGLLFPVSNRLILLCLRPVFSASSLWVNFCLFRSVTTLRMISRLEELTFVSLRLVCPYSWQPVPTNCVSPWPLSFFTCNHRLLYDSITEFLPKNQIFFSLICYIRILPLVLQKTFIISQNKKILLTRCPNRRVNSIFPFSYAFPSFTSKS